MCDNPVVDADEDGDPPIACGGKDCNDADPAVHSMASEVCNGRDDNCSGKADEGFGFAVVEPATKVASSTLMTAVALAFNATTKKYGLLYNEDTRVIPATSDVPIPIKFVPLSQDGVAGTASLVNDFGAGCGMQLIHDGANFIAGIIQFKEPLYDATGLAAYKLDDAGGLSGSIQVAGPKIPRKPTIATMGGQYLLGYSNGGYSEAVSLARTYVLNADLSVVGDGQTTWETAMRWVPSSLAAAPSNRVGHAFIGNDGKRRFRIIENGNPVGTETELGLYHLTDQQYWQNAPQQLVWSGDGWGLVGQRFTRASSAAGEYQIHFTRLGLNGEKVGITEIDLTTDVLATANPDSNPAGQLLPSIVWTGNYYLVAWSEADQLRVVKVGPDGKVLAGPFTVSGAAAVPGRSVNDTSPALAWSGSELGIAWVATGTGPTGTSTAHFARVNACAPTP